MNGTTSTSDEPEPAEQQWGRVLICGGTDWQSNGRKNRRAEEPTDLLSPHILRSVSHMKVVRIVSGCSADFAIVIDILGTAHIFGNIPGLARSSVSHEQPLHISPERIGNPGAIWVDGAAGYGNIFLIDNNGAVWGAGQNTTGQLGYPALEYQSRLVPIHGPWEDDGAHIVQVCTGILSTIFLSNVGDVYASGSSEHGLLGNNTTGYRIIKGNKEAFDMQATPELVHGLEGQRITQISAGNYHFMALSEQGKVFTWGLGDHGALGLGNRDDVLAPTLVPEFDGSELRKTAVRVLCGPSSSITIDGNHTMNVTGKWKLAGDGGHGKPFLSFRRLQGDRADILSIGGAGYFIRTDTPSSDGDTIYSWGEGALYGELGYGIPHSTSSQNPTPIKALRDMDVLSVAAGLWSTLFLVRPNDALAELDRWPLEVESADICLRCHEDLPDTPMLECERCDEPFHPMCLDPPITEWPEGQWFCDACTWESSQATWDYVVEEDELESPKKRKKEKGRRKSRLSMSVKPITSAEAEIEE